MSGTDAARTFAPATVGNVICGFDVFGLALEGPGDEVTASRSEEPGVTITAIHGDDGRLPLDRDENVVGVAAAAVLARAADAGYAVPGVTLELWKGLPLAAGMGGSAASAVAAVLATDALVGAGLDRRTLLACALEGERVAAGAGHPDNAAPCLFGGITLSRPGDPARAVPLPVPDGLAVALVRPPHELLTGQGRRVLPHALSLEDVVAQMGDAAAFVAALYAGDLELLSTALTDRVAEPARKTLVPGFEAVRRTALDSGALGAGISGSGPSMFALCRSLADADRAASAMVEAFGAAGLEGADRYVSPVAATGARIVPSAATDP